MFNTIFHKYRENIFGKEKSTRTFGQNLLLGFCLVFAVLGLILLYAFPDNFTGVFLALGCEFLSGAFLFIEITTVSKTKNVQSANVGDAFENTHYQKLKEILEENNALKYENIQYLKTKCDEKSSTPLFPINLSSVLSFISPIISFCVGFYFEKITPLGGLFILNISCIIALLIITVCILIAAVRELVLTSTILKVSQTVAKELKTDLQFIEDRDYMK